MTYADENLKLINLETINTEEINAILNGYFIGGNIDVDGDLLIGGPSRIYLNVDQEISILRFFCFVRLIDDWEKSAVTESLETINRASYAIKYSTMKTSIMVEYGIPLFGYIDHKHLIKVIHHMEGEVGNLKVALYNYIKG